MHVIPCMINMAFSFQNAEEVIVTCSGRIRYEIVRLTCSQLDLLLQREKKPLRSAAQLLPQGCQLAKTSGAGPTLRGMKLLHSLQ